VKDKRYKGEGTRFRLSGAKIKGRQQLKTNIQRKKATMK
jgi:hypothetical protein